MKLKKKRYTSEAEIVAAIDKARAKVTELIADAELLEEKSKDRSQSMLFEEAIHKRRRAFLLETEGMQKLKEKLAEFRTPLLPALDDGDRSIEV